MEREARDKGKILIDFFPLEPGVQVFGSLGTQLELNRVQFVSQLKYGSPV